MNRFKRELVEFALTNALVFGGICHGIILTGNLLRGDVRAEVRQEILNLKREGYTKLAPYDNFRVLDAGCAAQDKVLDFQSFGNRTVLIKCISRAEFRKRHSIPADNKLHYSKASSGPIQKAEEQAQQF